MNRKEEKERVNSLKGENMSTPVIQGSKVFKRVISNNFCNASGLSMILTHFKLVQPRSDLEYGLKILPKPIHI